MPRDEQKTPLPHLLTQSKSLKSYLTSFNSFIEHLFGARHCARRPGQCSGEGARMKRTSLLGEILKIHRLFSLLYLSLLAPSFPPKQMFKVLTLILPPLHVIFPPQLKLFNEWSSFSVCICQYLLPNSLQSSFRLI